MDVNDQVSASSEDTALDVAPETTGAEEVSSTSDEGVSQDVLSVVRDVVDESRQQTDAASPAEGQEVGSPDAQAPSAEPDNEEFTDVPFGKHPRFKQLIEQRNSFRQDAERYQNVQTFLDQNGLAANEAADALVIAGLMKTNPAEAWARMKPVVQQLLQAAGEVLPDDLSQHVQRGAMSHEAALEVSRARAQVESMKAYQSFEAQRAQRSAEQQRAQALYSTAANWEADRRAKDPNFEAKLVPLQKELAFLQMSEGKPSDPNGVLAQLKRAYDAVSGVGVAPAQQPRPRPAVRPVTGGNVSGTAQPKPQSMLEIIRANRAS